MQTPETELTIRSAAGALLLQTTLTPGEYVLGRSPQVELFFEAELVSREHARLTVNFDHLLIEDLGSSNGTFVNGQAVTTATRLWPNQKIQIGAATVEFHRVKSLPPVDRTLTPSEHAIQQMLPENLLRENKYEIGGVVAQGGMGAILDAKEAATERKVAMKVMLDSSDANNLARFITEAKITAQLEHPSIVPIYELSVDENNQVFYTMQFVRGITLGKVLTLMAGGAEATIRKYPLGALLTIFQKICDALAFAHSKAIIHRDLKPDNIMLGDFGEVLVMDWGLAKLLGTEVAGAASVEPILANSLSSQAGSISSTLAGTIMGTPQYMSPEQARGEVETLDARSDIYALGAILYHILALRPPVSGNEPWAIVEQVSAGKFEPLTAPKLIKSSHLPGGQIPESLSAVVGKAMAVDKLQRYSSVTELQNDLEAYQNGFATSAEAKTAWKQIALFLKRHKAASIGVAAVLVVGGGFGTKAITAGRQAERALNELRRTAPSLRQLAESEAEFQRFDSAMEKLEAAQALDPGDTPSYARKAWLYLGLKKLPEAAAAMKEAAKKDPANEPQLVLLERLKNQAITNWSPADRQTLFEHLQQLHLSGETVALVEELQLQSAQKLELVRQRVSVWLGAPVAKTITMSGLGQIELSLPNTVTTLEPLRGLPINRLKLADTKVTDLAPLKGMPLVFLNISRLQVTDLSPLQGMPLRELQMFGTPVSDIEPLRGLPLENLQAGSSQIRDFSPLAGMPLSVFGAGNNPAELDLRVFASAPLVDLGVSGLNVRDLSPLRGKPLKVVSFYGCPITDLSPLRGAPIVNLTLGHCEKLKDLSPLLDLPELQKVIIPARGILPEGLRTHSKLRVIGEDQSNNDRPAATFWAEYDQRRAKGK